MLTELEKEAIRVLYRNLSENLEGFRPRRSQREMLAAVAQTFARSLEIENDIAPNRNGESISLIEGPTGVGKSLAYLLSGSVLAQSRNKKLVVSSATVALQEQLVYRDLPFLAENSGLEITFALAKGRGRYLCPYRLYQITQNMVQGELGFDYQMLMKRKLDNDDRKTIHKIAEEFAERRFDGDRDNWKGGMLSDDLWIRINNDRHSCLKNVCPNRSECPFFLFRDAIENVDIIVANHDLLLSDIAMGGGVILPAPENCFYCIDEAHHLPDKAISQFACEHSLNDARVFLERFPQVSDKVAQLTGKVEIANLADETAGNLLQHLRSWETILGQSDCFPPSAYGDSIWLWQNGECPNNLREQVANTAKSAAAFNHQVNQLTEILSQARRDKNNNSSLIDQLSAEFGIVSMRSENIMSVWDLLNSETEPNIPPLAKWLTHIQSDNKRDYIFNASLVSASSQLIDKLWKKAAGAVLTSATLRAVGSFNMILEQTGLNTLPETKTVALDSPFNFAKQAELYIPPLKANPKDSEAHTQEIINWLPKLIDEKHAVGTLVLFSSRKQMEEVALKLPENYQTYLLIQGDRSKQQLIKEHNLAISEGRASIIFGLDSFAEGLDLPGEACVHVIIAKLPFAMPDDPVDKTLSEWIKQQGGNPFMQLSIPVASIKLTQAVGRLIRTENDYGRVTILDTRIITARYGKNLLDALPAFRRI
ncbi:MAG: ATP-dependent DNA helicase DinG [Neisseriaceae bacterium]|nr:ATP-dependent DNA helicase DinG [Neisseriaceae bacterium]